MYHLRGKNSWRWCKNIIMEIRPGSNVKVYTRAKVTGFVLAFTHKGTNPVTKITRFITNPITLNSMKKRRELWIRILSTESFAVHVWMGIPVNPKLCYGFYGPCVLISTTVSMLVDELGRRISVRCCFLRYQGTPNDNIAFSPFERQADPDRLYIFWKLNNWRLRKAI